MTKKSSEKSDALNGPYAIVEASGQQFWVQANRYYDFDRIKAKVDETVTLENVLFINDGKESTLGKPFIKDAKVIFRYSFCWSMAVR